MKCLVCGEKLGRNRAKFCSHACQQVSQYDKYIARWLVGAETGGAERDISEFVRRYIYSVRGKMCWQCGWSGKNLRTGDVPVQIDHIDGDSSNNAVDNLRLLCPNCHSLTWNFGNAGHTSARGFRYGKI